MLGHWVHTLHTSGDDSDDGSSHSRAPDQQAFIARVAVSTQGSQDLQVNVRREELVRGELDPSTDQEELRITRVAPSTEGSQGFQVPPPVLPVLRAHLSDGSVTTTELDVASLPDLTEDDRALDATVTEDDGAGDDGFDLLHGADDRMNGGCYGDYNDLWDLTRHRSRSPPGRWVLIDPSADEEQFSTPPPSRMIASSRVAPPHPMSDMFPVGAMFRNMFVQLSPPSTMLTIASGARAFVDQARGHCDGYMSVVARRGVQFYIGITENPQRRWEQHDIASPGMWSFMDVVLCAPCCAVTAALERYPTHPSETLNRAC